MRKMTLFILMLTAIPILTVGALTSKKPRYVPNELLVGTKGLESDSRFQHMNTSCGTRVEKEFLVAARGKSYLLKVIDGRSVENAIRCWKQFPEVDFAQPNYIKGPNKK